jgi:hypothetical protein
MQGPVQACHERPLLLEEVQVPDFGFFDFPTSRSEKSSVEAAAKLIQEESVLTGRVLRRHSCLRTELPGKHQ